jgi:hypothetical protein
MRCFSMLPKRFMSKCRVKIIVATCLERAGLVTVVHRGGLFRGPSTYRVNPHGKGVVRRAG